MIHLYFSQPKPGLKEKTFYFDISFKVKKCPLELIQYSDARAGIFAWLSIYWSCLWMRL